MTQYEMTEKLSDKCNVTLEEARNALEKGEWNVLTATHLLEKEQFRRMQELSAVASSCEGMAVQYAEAASEAREDEEDVTVAPVEEVVEPAQAAGEAPSAQARAAKRRHGHGGLKRRIRRVVTLGNRNRLVVRKGDETLLELPLTVLALLMLCAFWVCVPLLAIGLFAGCRYSVNGRDLGRENINRALDKAARAAERMKKAAAEA